MKEKALEALYAQIKGCRCQCPGEREGAGATRDYGNPDAGVVMLGEAPGKEEIKQGIPFAGQAGFKLNEYLQLAGLQRSDLYIINTVKCRPTKNNGRSNRKPNRCEISSCARWLEEELKILSPRVIITLGDIALKQFAGNSMRISDYHGRPLVRQQTLVFPLYHPAAVIYRRALDKVMAEDFVKLGRWLAQIKPS